jgi:hypothetical protein
MTFTPRLSEALTAARMGDNIALVLFHISFRILENKSQLSHIV